MGARWAPTAEAASCVRRDHRAWTLFPRGRHGRFGQTDYALLDKNGGASYILRVNNHRTGGVFVASASSVERVANEHAAAPAVGGLAARSEAGCDGTPVRGCSLALGEASNHDPNPDTRRDAGREVVPSAEFHRAQTFNP